MGKLILYILILFFVLFSPVTTATNYGVVYQYSVGKVIVTAYTSRECETDNTPFITASNKRVQNGYIAVSRDILKIAPYGTKVYLDIVGKNKYRSGFYIVEDTMHKRKKNWVDIWFADLKDAKEFGIKKGKLFVFYEFGA